MSNGYRNGAFALGLVVGGGLVLNLFLWLDYQAHKACKASPESCQESDYSEIGRYWDGFLGSFVSPSDTLAQWIMATFTIAATIVLVLTLWSANKTNKAAIAAASAANESNRIMRSGQRPWLKMSAKPVKIQKSEGKIEVTCEVEITNVGRAPALGVFLGATASAVPTFRENELVARSFASDFRSFADHMHQIIFPDDSLTTNYTTRVRTEGLDQREEPFLRETSKGLTPEVSFAVAYGSEPGGSEFHSIFSLIVLNQDGRAFHICEGESFDNLKFIRSGNFKAT